MSAGGGPRALEEALRRDVLLRLGGEWERINQAWRLGLRRPSFALLTEGRRWGAWDPAHRIISIHERQIVDHSWTSVLDTLKHEMAHQYVDEALGGADASPHGEAFARVCHRLGVDGSASGEGGPPADDSRLRRIRKLLALADDRGNEHEARAALAAARRLLLKHNIDLAGLEGGKSYTHRALGPPSRRTQAWRKRLGSILEDWFFVRCIWVPVFVPGVEGRSRQLEVSGTAFNVDMAEYVQTYLTDTCERLWRAWREKQGPRPRAAKLQFMDGAFLGFQRHLQAEAEEVEPGRTGGDQALVWTGDPGLDDYFRRSHPRVRSRAWRGAPASEARAEGTKRGQEIRIRRPIEATGSGSGGLLTGR
jgi:hypothetical protein